MTQYNPETGEGGLFVAYIITFLKLKADPSGYASWVHSPKEEDRYVDSFWQSEGIHLDKEAIRYNAAKRGLAKLCLKSMCGKLTEKNDRTMSRVNTEPKDLYGFLATPGVEVMNLPYASDDVVWMSWKYGAEEDVRILRYTNEVIGAYVTAGARIHLYRYLDRLRENAMYCDTVCVIYFQPSGEPH